MRNSPCTLYRWGCGAEVIKARPDQGVNNQYLSQRVLERLTRDGESPVGEKILTPILFPKYHGKRDFRGKLGGPPPKAKY